MKPAVPSMPAMLVQIIFPRCLFTIALYLIQLCVTVGQVAQFHHGVRRLQYALPGQKLDFDLHHQHQRSVNDIKC